MSSLLAWVLSLVLFMVQRNLSVANGGSLLAGMAAAVGGTGADGGVGAPPGDTLSRTTTATGTGGAFVRRTRSRIGVCSLSLLCGVALCVYRCSWCSLAFRWL